MGTARKLKVQMTLKRRPGRLLNVSCTLNCVLCPRGTNKETIKQQKLLTVLNIAYLN